MKNQNQCASLTIRFHTSSSAEITLESGRQFLTILALQKIMILYIFFGIDDKVFPEEVLTDQVQDFFLANHKYFICVSNSGRMSNSEDFI